MRNAYEEVLKLAAHDPLIASGLAILFLLIVPLGAVHLFRVFGGFFVLLIREFKQELSGIGKVLGNETRVDHLESRRLKAPDRVDLDVTR